MNAVAGAVSEAVVAAGATASALATQALGTTASAPLSEAVLYVLAAAAVFGIGVYGLFVAEYVLRKLLALNLMSSAVFLFLLTVAGERDGARDPVAQALVLTGIVIAVAATAFGLALLVRIHRETGTLTSRWWGDDAD
jgi:multicomponent Na+:H+ antiporter subunit C